MTDYAPTTVILPAMEGERHALAAMCAVVTSSHPYADRGDTHGPRRR